MHFAVNFKLEKRVFRFSDNNKYTYFSNLDICADNSKYIVHTLALENLRPKIILYEKKKTILNLFYIIFL